MQSRVIKLLQAILLPLIAVFTLAQTTPTPNDHLPNAPIDDRCVKRPDYAEFRQRLEQIVQRRDGAAFQALFDKKGAMRVKGFGGAASANWGLERPEAAQVWRELEDILSLGCSIAGDRLYLPAMAVLINHPDVEPDHAAALSDLMVSAMPGRIRVEMQRVKRGQLLRVLKRDEPEGWIEVRLNGRRAYVRATNVRSPHHFRLTVIRKGTSWRIREFTGGI